MEDIALKLHQDLASGSKSNYGATFTVPWELSWFMASQNTCPDTPIGLVITLTGSALACQAATCEDYMRETWGSRGLRFLNLLQYALDSPDHESRGKLLTSLYLLGAQILPNAYLC